MYSPLTSGMSLPKQNVFLTPRSMKRRDIDNKENATDLGWWSTLIVAAVIIGIAAYNAAAFPLSKMLVLGVSSFVAWLACRHKFDIPLTTTTFLPKALLTFWGIMWIGVSGGVLLGVVSAVVAYGPGVGERNRFLSRISIYSIATFAAAMAYYLVIGVLTVPGTPEANEKLFVPTEVIIASLAMAVTHTVTSAVINFFVNTGAIADTSITANLRRQMVGNSLTLCATLVFFCVFNHFGIEFGLVIVPIAVIGNLAHKIHLRKLDVKTKEITEASRLHLATVEALATAIDARDQVGTGHVRRTQIYAVGLGNLLALPARDIDAIRTGALLHDIGKLAVPDHILNKPGKLTPAEMEKTKIHSLVGAAILENVGFDNPVVPTVKYHHESWDGKGYPEQLAGNEIPLTARILAIADAFDTLRGARPYRPAVPRDEACSYLRARSGTQFDPQLVDLFVRNLKSFETEITRSGLSYELERDSILRTQSVREVSGVMSYVEQIQRANREVFTLYSLAKDFSSALDLDQTLSLFTKKIGEFVPFDTCLVYLANDEEESATAIHAVGLHAETLKDKRVEFGEGATGFALKKREAVNNIDPALDFALEHDHIGREYIAMASLPLMVEERLIGAISLYSNSTPSYQEEHMRLLETVSRIAADAIAKSLQHAQAETYALTDPMTSLPNARSLQIHFEKEVKRSARKGTNFQVLMLDLDGFKAVNDTFGHKTGDLILKGVSSIIRNELRDYDFLARYAGDEFVAIVPETDSHGVLELCRRIEAAVNSFELTVAESVARVGVSVGSACYPRHGESFDQVLIAADKAMYLTKAVHKQRTETPKPQKADIKAAFESAAIEECSVIVPDADDMMFIGESLVLELDETHIIAGSAIN